MIVNGCGGMCFLDGKSYKPLFHRSVHNECEWHPTDPALMICVLRNMIYTWAPRSDARTIVYTSTQYGSFEFGPYKGNPSNDGSRLVVPDLSMALAGGWWAQSRLCAPAPLLTGTDRRR